MTYTPAGIDIVLGIFMIMIILTAAAVALTTLHIMSFTSKIGITQTPNQPLENTETKLASVLQSRLNALRTGLRKFLSLWTKFVFQRRNVSPDPPPADEEPAINEQSSIPIPDGTCPEPETSDILPFLDQEVPNIELTNEEETKVNMLNIPPAEPAREVPNQEPLNEEETTVDTFSTEPTEHAQGWPQEQPESTEPEPEKVVETSENGLQKSEVSGDTMQDIFATEVVEEDDVSKLAKNLDNVNASDLLEEAQNLINQINQNRKR